MELFGIQNGWKKNSLIDHLFRSGRILKRGGVSQVTGSYARRVDSVFHARWKDRQSLTVPI